MTGEPIASGREADVYALDDGRVLRRYRDGGDVTGEAEVMAYAGGLGYPVPRVFAARGTDLVMERLDGPTMAEACLSGELTPEAAGEVMADLLRRLHELPAREGAPGRTVVHLDLHPENVLMTSRGPVVIDWRNARDGDADFDTALSALILAQVTTGALRHDLGAGAGVMLDRLLALVPGDPLGRLDEVLVFRAGQTTMSAEEVAMLPAAADRVRGVR